MRTAFTKTSRSYTKPRISEGSALLNTPLSALACVLLFSFFLIENPIEPLIPGLNYFDEFIFLVSCLCALVVVWHRREHFGGVLPFAVLLCLVAITFGISGNIVNSFQSSTVAIASEAIACLKFPLTLVAFIVLLRNVDRDAVINGCSIVSKVFIVICTFFCIVNIVDPMSGYGHDVRNGIMSFKFIYTHPTFLVLSLVLVFSVLEAQKVGPSIWKVICLVLIAATMRDKGFGFIAFVLFIWFFKVYRKKRLFKYVLIAGIVSLIAASQKITEYMSFSNSPREALYATAIQIAVASFPFGGGLASIASSLSGRYYSLAYHQYGLSDMIGLAPTDFMAAADAGIPFYIGQLGFIGSALFGCSIFLIFKYLLSIVSPGSSCKSALVALIGYVLIAITVEAVLTNASGLTIAVTMAYLVCGKRKSEKPRRRGCRIGFTRELSSE